MNALAEKDCLPMLLSTSDMIKPTPLYEPNTGNFENHEVKTKLTSIEKSLNSLTTLMKSTNKNKECHCKTLPAATKSDLQDRENVEDLTHLELLPISDLNETNSNIDDDGSVESENSEDWEIVPSSKHQEE